MRKFLLALFIVLNALQAKSQQKADSSLLKEVAVTAYFSEQPLLKSPASVSIIGSTILDNHQNFSLVSAINTSAGVRMEERSPGSYRLSIRGSLLRSPFGIRNVKIYMDNFMLTDAGGNTYLNLLDAGSTSGIEIIKGPEGSIYGANSGGVVLIHPSANNKDSSMVSASITGGSYGLFHEKVSLQNQWKNFQIGINQAYQRSDGYRENSSLDRKYIHVLPQWAYSAAGKLKAIVLYSDLSYETPGGLTLQQFNTNPRAARPTSGAIPGAIAQHATIYNETFLGGLSHEYQLTRNFKHVVSFSASGTDFKNPTFRNYEFRKEKSLGLRTFAQLSGNEIMDWKLQAGLEIQQTTLDKDTYRNDLGKRDTLQNSDYLQARQGFGFIHFSINPTQKLFVESAVSVNLYRYAYESFFPKEMSLSNRSFDKELMPRLAASYLLNPSLSLRASISRGYSPPTLEEVNPSNQAINATIQAEKGWNREAGFRLSVWKNRLYWDAVYFNYSLKDAIVRAVKINEADYYINAGGTKQQGVESEIIANILSKNTGFLKNLQFRNSYTLSLFNFSDYVNEGTNFSGKRLTGVPKNIIVSSVSAGFSKEISLFLQHNYTSSLPLNDANTVYSKNCHLVDIKASWGYKLFQSNFRLFAGANNLLNKKYSLGYDLNAVGGRYYNAASTRNFYAGLATSF